MHFSASRSHVRAVVVTGGWCSGNEARIGSLAIRRAIDGHTAAKRTIARFVRMCAFELGVTDSTSATRREVLDTLE